MPQSVHGRAKQLIHECISHRHAKPLWPPTISSLPVTRPSTQKPPSAWKRIKNGVHLFTAFWPSIGPTCAPLIPLNRPLLPYRFVLKEQKDVTPASQP